MMQLEDGGYLENLKNNYTRRSYRIYWDKYVKSNPPKTTQKNAKLIQQHIKAYLTQLNREGLSYSSRMSSYSAIKRHYSKIDDILINWDNIRDCLGSDDKKFTVRAYTHEEIQKLLDVADLKYRAIILLLASSGVRRQALVDIKLSHMKLLEGNIYKIEKIYEHSKEEYVAFTTPETTQAIQKYIEVEKPTSYLFYGEDGKGNPTRDQPMTAGSISNAIRHLALKVNIGSPVGKSNSDRSETPALHGCRKFCITQMAEAGIDNEIRKILTGHSIGVEEDYVQRLTPSFIKKLENEYKKAISLLTINKQQHHVIVQKESDKDKEIQALKEQKLQLDQKQQEFETELEQKDQELQGVKEQLTTLATQMKMVIEKQEREEKMMDDFRRGKFGHGIDSIEKVKRFYLEESRRNKEKGDK